MTISFQNLRIGGASASKVVQRLSSHLNHPHKDFNGAADIICVNHSGSIQCTGFYLSISRLSSVRYFGRDSDIKIKINDTEVDGFSINLNKISRHIGKNDFGVPVYTPTNLEKELIFNHLLPGRNKITFYIEDQPSSSIDARIYSWEWDSRVIVVDVDGTITRSELRGLIHCYTEEPYLRPDVFEFFRHLKASGYKFIYLTARPISIINSTRKYIGDNIDEVVREGHKVLPEGPIFTSCDGRIRTSVALVGAATGLGGTSHYDFKASFLMQIRECFNVDEESGSPLYAGFGNTEADERSYRSAGIPDDRIFRVTKEGNIIHRDTTFTSYGDLHNKCAQFFQL